MNPFSMGIVICYFYECVLGQQYFLLRLMKIDLLWGHVRAHNTNAQCASNSVSQEVMWLDNLDYRDEIRIMCIGVT